MTNQIVTTNESNIAALADRFKLLVSNGKNLEQREALALAQYSAMTDLNPFAGECYYLPGIGPGPGIAGWRKKADEQLAWEAHKAAEPMARYWSEYSEPTGNEIGNLTSGDIAVKATLHDSLSKTQWEKRRLGHMIELMKAGVPSGEAWEYAVKVSGDEPTWSAIGIVKITENFGGDKMNRYERACKRAEKAAIRKRFPRISLPEPIGFDPSDVIETTITEIHDVKPEAQIMEELGYGKAQTTTEMKTEPPDITADLAHLAGICNHEGTAYILIDPKELANMSIGIGKALAKNGLTDEQKAEYKRKQSAIGEILEWHKSNATA